jgi:hypothetical protein
MRCWHILAAALVANFAAALPQNFAALECAVAQFAAGYAASKLSYPQAPASLSDALNVEWLCVNQSVTTAADYASAFAAETQRHVLARVPAPGPGAVATFFVAVTGSDSAPGTQAAPFATLARAAARARAVPNRTPGDVTVYVRAGTYYFGSTGPLALTEDDSNVAWAAFPGDAPAVLSGAVNLNGPGLVWTNATTGAVPGILVAPVTGLPPDRRAQAWTSVHGTSKAGPPPLVASLFINGVRQVRARYPNGNPQDGSGICFSANQRPGEGCAGYSTCAGGSTGKQPAPPGVQVAGGPNRGQSPTWGCPQCNDYSSFSYTIYPPPSDHPVYNVPLPGVGWSNTSVFSFWGSPFDRPSGVLVDSTCGENDNHWSKVNYANPSDAVVHMFHSGLWGGWQYRVDSVTSAPSLPASLPRDEVATSAPPSAGLAIWLDATTIGGTDGQALSSWADASGNGNKATQGDLAKQPTYVASPAWTGGKPIVRFQGAQVLQNSNVRLGASMTMLAALRDTGTTTNYCSGVFCSGSLNSLCTKAATAPSPAATDDDPSTPGSSIVTTSLDWASSPVNPGHRSLANRTIVLSATYSSEQSVAYVDGCTELVDKGYGATGRGFFIGSRNDEMNRYLVGDIGEVLVYDRVLNATEHAAAVAYLSAKWAIAPIPKKCEPGPSPPHNLAITFSYGGYQEARGSGINPGQNFFIENVFEELDVPGEWFWDASNNLLYVLPNSTMQALQAATIAMPVLDSVITVNGSQSGTGAYASSISFTGFTITQTRVTYLEQYEVPSGGDWSVHRGAALLIQDAENVTISGCTFDQVGGNGIIFSNHVAFSSLVDNNIIHSGDSAIVLLGSTNGVDGSAPTYPNHNLIARNWLHETGVYGKQTSCIAQQLTANSTITDNVCHNGPRAGINANDGFAGGHLFTSNVVFNQVRETGDHGPLNSWDRQPYLAYSRVDDGFNDPRGLSIIKANDTNAGNLMINGYNGVWTFDHDDGSQFVNDVGNMMVWGGCKNYMGNHKQCDDNVILYPGIGGRSAGGRRCQTDDNGVFAEQFHTGNTCSSADGDMYSFSSCNPGNVNSTAYVTRSNTLLIDAGASFASTCGASTFAAWQALGQDIGSTVAATPNVSTLIALGAAKLLGPGPFLPEKSRERY